MKLKTDGIIMSAEINAKRIPQEATIPNCTNSEEFVIVNVAKPAAVVRLLRNTALPILEITLCKAKILFP
jgi:hypothetical protein